MIENLWKTENLESILFLIESGKRPKGGVSEDLGTIPSLGGENLTQDGNLDFTSVKTIPESFYDSLTKSKLEDGDVLINKDGAQTGKVGIYRGEFDRAAINEHLFRMRGKDDKITQLYLFYYLLWEETQQKIGRVTTGSAQPGINSSFPKYINISYPKLPLQHEITKILNNLESLINIKNDLIEKLKQIKQGLLHDLHTRGVDENGRLRNSASVTTKYKETSIGRFHNTWRVESLENLVSIDPEGLDSSTDDDYEFKYIDISSVNRGEIDWKSVTNQVFSSAPSRARRIVRPGDVLLGTVRPRLQSHAIADWNDTEGIICSTGFAVLRTNGEVKPKYLFYLLFSDIVHKQLLQLETGSNYPAVSKSDLRTVYIPLPELTEQNRIIQYLETIECRIIKEKEYLEKQEMVKKGLMDDLLTGRVRVDRVKTEQQESTYGSFSGI